MSAVMILFAFTLSLIINFVDKKVNRVDSNPKNKDIEPRGSLAVNKVSTSQFRTTENLDA